MKRGCGLQSGTGGKRLGCIHGTVDGTVDGLITWSSGRDDGESEFEEKLSTLLATDALSTRIGSVPGSSGELSSGVDPPSWSSVTLVLKVLVTCEAEAFEPVNMSANSSNQSGSQWKY